MCADTDLNQMVMPTVTTIWSTQKLTQEPFFVWAKRKRIEVGIGNLSVNPPLDNACPSCVVFELVDHVFGDGQSFTDRWLWSVDVCKIAVWDSLTESFYAPHEIYIVLLQFWLRVLLSMLCKPHLVLS